MDDPYRAADVSILIAETTRVVMHIACKLSSTRLLVDTPSHLEGRPAWGDCLPPRRLKLSCTPEVDCRHAAVRSRAVGRRVATTSLTRSEASTCARVRVLYRSVKGTLILTCNRKGNNTHKITNSRTIAAEGTRVARSGLGVGTPRATTSHKYSASPDTLNLQ